MDADPATPGDRNPAVGLFVRVLTLYRRWLSPLLPPSCRFHPTCSAYAVDALRVHGVVIGIGLTLVRLAKCAPWHPGGLDPVPGRADLPRFLHPWTGPASPDDSPTEEHLTC